MAEAGIGVDLVEIAQMERIMRVTPAFIPRMFTEEERAYCDAAARPAAHYACRFAAREAVLKSLGTGFGQNGVGRCDVSVSRDANGRPIAVLSGGALCVAQELGVLEVAISLSFTGELAVANAMAITADARPKPKEDKLTERQRIAQSFKEARSVLDELERVQESELLETTGESPITEERNAE
ncbi:holo-ACP synthase [Collinsella provencensis]|uniref:holo-ACP synthase n=1 Tax=Collinsella provencensis TaxID=1937461 RepID=UPI000C821F93|nr:holo-ACP synthase [Collinsella provencensis]